MNSAPRAPDDRARSAGLGPRGGHSHHLGRDRNLRLDPDHFASDERPATRQLVRGPHQRRTPR